MISDTISYMILYWYKVYLAVLVPEVVTLNVKRSASCLGSAIEKFTLPLDTIKRVQFTMISSNEISSDDCIQLWCCPQAALLLGDPQLVAKVGPDPLGQLGGNPSQNWMHSSVCVGNVVMPWITSIVLDHIITQGLWHYMLRVGQKSSWFQ